MRSNRISKLLEALYLTVFAMLIAYCFLTTTMFQIEWPGEILQYLTYTMLLITLLRMGYSERYTGKELILCAVIYLPLLAAWQRNGWEILFPMLILILGAKGISFRRLLTVYASTKAVLLVITVVCALTGVIENLVYRWEGRNTRIAFGIAYPTDFSAQLFFLMLCYFYLRRERLRYIEIFFAGILGVFVYAACEARWNAVCFLGTMCVFLYDKIRRSKAEKKKVQWEMAAWFAKTLALMPVLCGAVMIGLSILYNPENPLMGFLNKLTSQRLVFGKKAIDVYGFSILGQQIPMHGNGGTTMENLYGFYLDSSYLSIVMQFGLVVLGVVLLIWLCISFDALQRKDYVFLWIIAIVCVQCMIEHHMLEAAYNPFLWALFADMAYKPDRIQIKRDSI